MKLFDFTVCFAIAIGIVLFIISPVVIIFFGIFSLLACKRNKSYLLSAKEIIMKQAIDDAKMEKYE